MSIFERTAVLEALKVVLKRTIFRPGRTVRVLHGPLRGYRYVISEAAGWASIYGGWEPTATQAYQRFVLPEFVVFDLGANTGMHTLLFSKLVGRQGRVVAFEPFPENAAILRSLLALNAVTNVDIRTEALADASGRSTFKLGTDPKQGSLVGIGGETGKEITVDVESLDNLIERGLPAPDFVKIDIEGAESAALAGFRQKIAQTYPSFAIELHTPEEDVRVGTFFAEHGYKLYRLRDATSVKKTGQKELLAPIHQYDVGWPNDEGVWGTIFAVHSTRQ